MQNASLVHKFILEFHYLVVMKIDFNKRYGLEVDTVVSVSNLLVPNFKFGMSVEALQKSVADIQLSPKVPDPVKVEFQQAKDLIIFSYFRYSFFTMSIRSALFAHESAMKLRYIQSLDRKAVLKCKSETVGELVDPSYFGIREHITQVIKTRKCKRKDVLVNDTAFPHTMEDIALWLTENGIPKEKLEQYEAARHIRNSLAHPERQIVLTPSAGILRNVAYDINEMFEI